MCADLSRESSWYAHHHHHHHHHHQLTDELVMYATPTPAPTIGKFGLDTSTEGYLNARYNGKRPLPRPPSWPDAASCPRFVPLAFSTALSLFLSLFRSLSLSLTLCRIHFVFAFAIYTFACLLIFHNMPNLWMGCLGARYRNVRLRILGEVGIPGCSLEALY